MEDRSQKSGLLPREEFRARFKARMLEVAGETFDDGESIAAYADEVSDSYFEDQHMLDESPEDCAESDISYWGD